MPQILSFKNKGFTIVELIVTIFILSIAVIGVFGAFSIMIVLTSTSADRLTAAYLAQEGVEIIRNIRDTNWLEADTNTDIDTAWDEGLQNCESALGCMVDYRTTGSTEHPVIPRTNSDSDYLGIDAMGFYNYNEGTPTKFKRKITITYLPDGDSSSDYIMKVSVEVFWDQKPNILNPNGGQESIKAEDTLYNWY
ncbi:MAG: prepilin-type N-terminal cleavage/methylation domain-containing protein [Candidatus Staskawiczbacteria bacterium]|nr:prepilin-type N-terminal cleavage/methylation domain-containing protein [Candidatus Staskawiczbacteria bacterium]